MKLLSLFNGILADCTYLTVICGSTGLALSAFRKRYRVAKVLVYPLLGFNVAAVAAGLHMGAFSSRYVVICGILFLIGCGIFFDVLLRYRGRYRVLAGVAVVAVFVGGMVYGVAKCCRFAPRDATPFVKLGSFLANIRGEDRPVLCLAQSNHFNRLFFYGKVENSTGFKVEGVRKDFSGDRPDMERYFQENYNSLLLFFQADRDRARQDAQITERFPNTKWDSKLCSGKYCLWFARNRSECHGKPLSAPALQGEVVFEIDFRRVEPYDHIADQYWRSIQKRHKITFRDIPEGKFFPGVLPNPGHGFQGEITLIHYPEGGMEFRSAASGGFTTREVHLVPGNYVVSVVYGGARGGRVEIGTYRSGCWPTKKFSVFDDGTRRGEGVFEVKQDYRGTLFFAIYGTVKISNIKVMKLQ